MTDRMAFPRSFVIGWLPLVLLMACDTAPAGPGGQTPPVDPSEGIVTVQTERGRASAHLAAAAPEIDSRGTITVYVQNAGEVVLSYGRPLMVERWEGGRWVETAESRNAAWTMELILVAPGQRGVEQPWPFSSASTPAAGWYRFTKSLQADGATGAPQPLIVRARVRVTD